MKRTPLLILAFCFSSIFLRAQTAAAIIDRLQLIHQSVTKRACGTDSAAAISQRAMNVFLADKTGYLSGSRDLSFFTNYVTINSAESRLTVSHNFQQKPGLDDPVKKLLNIGFDMTLAGSYAKDYLDKRFENELGITVNYKWLGKVKTHFADCKQPAGGQKTAMDAARTVLLKQLEFSITEQENNFFKAAAAIDSMPAPAKAQAQQQFYTALEEDASEKFAEQQAELLTRSGNYQYISTHWTSITAYIPLYFPQYAVAADFNSNFQHHHSYPLSVQLGYTQLWESAAAGRLFCTIEAGLLFNNAKLGYGLSKFNYAGYKAVGGTAPVTSAEQAGNKLYIGSYNNFITPSVNARLVYFPSNSHVGITAAAEKSFGKYDLLNARLGIPIVLINAKKTPAVNIECYFLFFNLGNTNSLIGHSSAGLSIGIPFSRLMY